MIFTETTLEGAFILDVEFRHDERGFFGRTFCQREFAAHGLKAAVVQTNCAFSRHKGSVRGLHFQYPPSAETKIVRCTRGAIFDVIVDLRPESPTYLRHVAAVLTADNRRSLYVPERFAHGYQVLQDGSETIYQLGEFYTPSAEDGVAYDDPLLSIDWPLPITDVSAKDRAWRRLGIGEPDLRVRMMLAGDEALSEDTVMHR